MYLSRSTRCGLFLAVFAVSGVAQDSPTADVASFEAVTDLRQNMEWILEPAAEVIWDSAGAVITEAGERDLSPTSEEGWADVVNASALLAEAGNLMMIPGRSAGLDWNRHAMRMSAAGKQALDAAVAKDATALFDAGGEIYQACLACHMQYWADSRQN
ncbi:MAG: hypothetical protein AAGG55_16260 [Pseudomonadota bacterium]